MDTYHDELLGGHPLPTDRAGWEALIRARCPAELAPEILEDLSDLPDAELPDLAAALGGLVAAWEVLAS